MPESVRKEVRLEVSFRGNGATIYERRPPFLSSLVPAPKNNEWTRLSVAQFRYDAGTRRWALYYADRSSRWHLYDDVDSPERLEDLIADVDADPTGIFWG